MDDTPLASSITTTFSTSHHCKNKNFHVWHSVRCEWPVVAIPVLITSSEEGMAVRMSHSRNTLSYDALCCRTPHAMLEDTGTYFEVKCCVLPTTVLRLCSVLLLRHLDTRRKSFRKSPRSTCPAIELPKERAFVRSSSAKSRSLHSAVCCLNERLKTQPCQKD